MRVTQKLKTISAVAITALVVLAPVLIGSLGDAANVRHELMLVDELEENFFERTSLRDQYFLYHEDRTRAQWDENKLSSDHLLSQTESQFQRPEDQQTLARIRDSIEDSAAIFHRVVANSDALKTASGNREIQEELNKRLSSQLLLKASAIRDALSGLKAASEQRTEQIYQRLTIIVAVLTGTLALATLLVSASLNSLIRKRLQPLHQGAKLIGDGDLSYRITSHSSDEFGELAHSVNAMTDKLVAEISERKAAEQALQASEARYRLLAASTFEGIALTEKGCFIDANDQLLTMFGYARQELIGRSIADLVSDANRERVMDNVLNGRESHVEVAMVRKDGELIQVEAHGQNNQNAGRAIRITVLRDITRRRQLETELEQHRRHLEALVEERTAALMATEARAIHLLESSADGLYGVDPTGKISFINPAACRMLGFSPDQAIGRSAHALFHHRKPDGSPFPIEECRGHDAVLRGHQMRIDNEVYWHSSGHAVPVMYAIHPIVQDGLNGGAVISFVDMSEQRAAAQAREKALIAAEKLARIRSEFLANMSHEIRTPLNGVLGFAQIGLRNYLDGDKARNAFEKILSSGTHLLGVINEILDFSKIEAGKTKLEQAEVNLDDVIGHTRELVAERALAKGIEVRLERADDLPATCLADPLRLTQVLLNLLSNAVKFTEDGSVCLSTARVAKDLVFRISDTGIGIRADQLALLFNPFQQADGSTTRRFGGSGLGLVICKRLVELMGGSIRVESQPGVGSCFEFCIPYLPAPASSPPPTPPTEADTPPANRPLAGISILVAEDDAINQMVIEENLIEDGATVAIANNGREAVDRMLRDGCQTYDVVLMDIQMPEMDGYQATRLILEQHPELPIIGQTAHASQEEREKCLATGMVAHIAKPIDPQALTSLIRQYASPRTA